jgi:hypothetical protein
MKKFETLRHSNKRIRFGRESKLSAQRGSAHRVKGPPGICSSGPPGSKLIGIKTLLSPGGLSLFAVGWWRGAQKTVPCAEQ